MSQVRATAGFMRRRDEMWFKYGREHLANPRAHLLDLPGLKTQLCAPGYHEDTTKRIQVETKKDIQKRTGQPSGNLADAYLQARLVHIHTEAPKAAEQPKHPPAFVKHFARFRARQQLNHGDLIR